MAPQTNHSLSVDCVIFGFDGTSLNVLLVRREYTDRNGASVTDFKLPGNLIFENEELQHAAYRTLQQYTPTRDIYLRQLHVFSAPDRVSGDELRWLNEYYRVDTTRVVTVAYYSLVGLDARTAAEAGDKGAQWFDVETVCRLPMDHKEILSMALDRLGKQLLAEPIAFELLPRRFTLRQLQMLYEAILGIEIDNRNFRKKVLSSQYVQPTGEREKCVAHKPAMYYTFNKQKFLKDSKLKFRLNFINWQV